jgi:hypothetical protein
MLLYHATLASNLESIGRTGLCCSRVAGQDEGGLAAHSQTARRGR